MIHAHAIEEFDLRIPELLEAMEEDDLLMITADHGNDPTFTGTDHTREYVPLLVYSKKMKEQGALPQGYYSDTVIISKSSSSMASSSSGIRKSNSSIACA